MFPQFKGLTREKQFHLVFGVSAKKFRLEMWRFVIMTGQDKYLSPWSNDVALQDVEIDVGNVWINFIWLKHVSQSLRTAFIWTHFELHSLNAFFPLPLKNFLTLSYSCHRCFSISLARLQLQLEIALIRLNGSALYSSPVNFSWSSPWTRPWTTFHLNLCHFFERRRQLGQR